MWSCLKRLLYERRVILLLNLFSESLWLSLSGLCVCYTAREQLACDANSSPALPPFWGESDSAVKVDIFFSGFLI